MQKIFYFLRLRNWKFRKHVKIPWIFGERKSKLAKIFSRFLRSKKPLVFWEIFDCFVFGAQKIKAFKNRRFLMFVKQSFTTAKIENFRMFAKTTFLQPEKIFNFFHAPKIQSLQKSLIFVAPQKFFEFLREFLRDFLG